MRERKKKGGHACRLEAIALRLEAVAIRLEAAIGFLLFLVANIVPTIFLSADPRQFQL